MLQLLSVVIFSLMKDHHSTDVHCLEVLDLFAEFQNEYREFLIYCHYPVL